MLVRSRSLLGVAAAAALAQAALLAPAAAAADPDANAGRQNYPAQTPMLPFGPSGTRDMSDVPGRRPLMGLLDQAGLGRPLDDARIQLYGHIEGSYTYNFNDPPRNLADYQIPVGRFIDNPGRVFDVEHDKVLMNQLVLNVARTVDATQRQWDVGGRVELMYGADARFLHANGLFDNYEDDETSRVTGGPQNQFDIPQAYLDVAVPVGNGLRVRVGKFTFFKQHDPNASVFYSHSFTFGAALPFTLTGAFATYVVNDQVTVDAGFSRGWDQALDDNNGAIDGFARVRYAPSREAEFSLAFITGPEQDGDNGNYRTAINGTATYRVNEGLTLLGDVLYAQQAQPDTGTGGDARWYGASVYAVQTINRYVSAAVRLEWYRDEGGYTTGLDQTLYEATAGLTIRPFANDPYLQHLKIRPEVRFDYSNVDYFDGFSRNTQFTAAVDAIYNF